MKIRRSILLLLLGAFLSIQACKNGKHGNNEAFTNPSANFVQTYDTIYSKLQGKWVQSDNTSNLLEINNDIAIFTYTDSGTIDTSKLLIERRILTEDGRHLQSPDGECYFILEDRYEKSIFSLISLSASEFVIMALSNGQTVVYKKG